MSQPEFPADLTFLHLSDIHFRKGRMGDVHDPDADLRNELERDLRVVRSTRIQKLDGIILSGDIAFAGQSEEYSFARGWIEKIRELLDCPKTGIMTIPGNHDVDRGKVEDGGAADQLHDRIRQAQSLDDRDEIIAAILRDPDSGAWLFSSIAAYNEFARTYECSIQPDCPYWERDFALGNRGILRVRGMTSTLISGPRDHAVTHKVAYGSAQRMLLRNEGVYRLVVGHHPPSWTLEGDDADRCFSERSVIQMYGHKHDQWYSVAGRGVRLIAGAFHPERRESNWDPRYSFLALKLDEEGRLLTRVYPRRWSREEMTFIGDFNSQGRDFRDHVVIPEQYFV